MTTVSARMSWATTRPADIDRVLQGALLARCGTIIRANSQAARVWRGSIPSPSTRPPWERAPAGARRVKTALTLGTQVGWAPAGVCSACPGRG
jgi:hypothetical protein